MRKKILLLFTAILFGVAFAFIFSIDSKTYNLVDACFNATKNSINTNDTKFVSALVLFDKATENEQKEYYAKSGDATKKLIDLLGYKLHKASASVNYVYKNTMGVELKDADVCEYIFLSSNRKDLDYKVLYASLSHSQNSIDKDIAIFKMNSASNELKWRPFYVKYINKVKITSL